MATFDLPDLGEGLTEAAVLRWLVAPGDTVTLNQPIVEVETAKAAVEVPSPFAGVVAELHAEVGDEAQVGSPLITITTVAEAAAAEDAGLSAADTAADEGSTEPPARTPVLVGYGPRTGAVSRRPRKHSSPASPVPAQSEDGGRPSAPAARVAPAPEPVTEPTPLAKPLVRKLAKERGVDLRTVHGTGPHGTVTRDDVEAATVTAEPAGGSPATSTPVTGVRKAMAEAMVRSAFSAPHATLFLTVDVTATMQLVQRLRPELEGVRVNPLLMTARALLLGLRRHPEANASWADGSVVSHPQVNLGIAAATPRGLLVPNVKDAGALSLADLGRALGALVETAREGRTPPADLARGTATITNIGSFGIDAGTPILNPGESVILALGTVRPTPWVVDGAVVVRDVCQLALAFDHRVLDGQQAAALLADVGRVLSDPDVALAWS